MLADLKCFSEIRFIEDGHKYFWGDQELLPCSRFCRQFQPETKPKPAQLGFDTGGEQARQTAMALGTAIHAYIAGYLRSITLGQPKPTPNPDQVQPEIRAFFDAWRQLGQFLKPVAVELVIGDQALGLAGTVDVIFLNRQQRTFHLADWKTGKLPQNAPTNLLPPFQMHPASSFTQASLQLAVYELILSRNVRQWKWGNSYLIHLKEDGSYYTYTPNNLKRELRAALDRKI
jgi:hypothetical protein